MRWILNQIVRVQITLVLVVPLVSSAETISDRYYTVSKRFIGDQFVRNGLVRTTKTSKLSGSEKSFEEVTTFRIYTETFFRKPKVEEIRTVATFDETGHAQSVEFTMSSNGKITLHSSFGVSKKFSILGGSYLLKYSVNEDGKPKVEGERTMQHPLLAQSKIRELMDKLKRVGESLEIGTLPNPKEVSRSDTTAKIVYKGKLGPYSAYSITHDSKEQFQYFDQDGVLVKCEIPPDSSYSLTDETEWAEKEWKKTQW